MHSLYAVHIKDRGSFQLMRLTPSGAGCVGTTPLIATQTERKWGGSTACREDKDASGVGVTVQRLVASVWEKCMHFIPSSNFRHQMMGY